MADCRRVVLIGKSGSGKSSLANTIFGEAIFKVNHSSDSKSKFSEAKSRTVKGLNLTLIDTPGIYNADRTAEDVRCEVYSCLTQCAPGPHAFLFVLLVEKFTEQEQDIVDQVKEHFGENVFKYTTVVFTHGDQLQEGTEIMQFVDQSKGLQELIQKCGGRCHVIDNKYWKSGQDPYRSNSVQVEKILNSIQSTARANDGSFFTNEMLVSVEKEIKKEQDRFQSQGLSLEESRERAKGIVLQNYIRNQKRQRYIKRFFIGLSAAGFSIVTLIFIVPRVFNVFRGTAVTGSTPYADEALTPTVMEVVQEAVAPIKSTLDYIIEAIEAVFIKKTNVLPNKTVTEL